MQAQSKINKFNTMIVSFAAFLFWSAADTRSEDATPGRIVSCTETPEAFETFLGNLSTCKKFSCRFQHMIMGTELQRDILGRSSGKCAYREEMPNGGEWNCLFDNTTLSAFTEIQAFFFKLLELAEKRGESVRTEVTMSLDGGKMRYLIGDEEFEQPPASKIVENTDQCKVTGYE